MTIKETIILSKILVHMFKKNKKKIYVKTESNAKAVLYSGGSFAA